MINTKKKYYHQNRGAAMIIVVLFFVVIGSTILIGIISPVLREYNIVIDSLDSKKSYFLAESGVEDLLYRLKNNKKTNGEKTLILGDTVATTNITDITSDKKEIISTGDTKSVQRRVKIIADTGVGVSFSYGVLAGIGGFSMGNNSKIVGSVYSNGPITGSGIITGAATSANSPDLAADQSNEGGSSLYDIQIGNLDTTQDFAQGFQVSKTGVASKVQLYIKKVNAPSNITVRLTTNNTDMPSLTILTSATLPASAVSTNYGWVDVPFSTSVQLSPGVTYWLVLDGVTSSSKYYYLKANLNVYLNGFGKLGQYGGNWSKSVVAGKDIFFKLYMGGITGLISGVKVGTETVGNAYAHTVNSATISGINYCQTGTGNNKSCNTTLADPVQKAMPISEQNILDWKAQAELGGVTNGNYTVPSNMNLGPRKITGNLTIDNGVTLTAGGPIWVQGDVLISNNSLVKLNSSFGGSSGVIIADGTITVSNNAKFGGSGAAGSYILVVSTSSSATAIQLANNAGAVALYAANGTINVANNGGAKSINGYAIHLDNNAVITYDTGLTDLNFTSGPSGSWNIDAWQETQ